MALAMPSVMLMPHTLYRLLLSTTADSASGSFKWPTKVVLMKDSSMRARLCSSIGSASLSSLLQCVQEAVRRSV
jgi:hypothetical protein